MSDLISRQAVMKEFSDFVRSSNNSDFAKIPTWNDAVSLVGSMPSAQVTLCHLDSPCEYQNADIMMPTTKRVGKWIATKEWGGRNFSCSECRFEFMVDTCMLKPMWNYCPNCGARMEGDGDE